MTSKPTGEQSSTHDHAHNQQQNHGHVHGDSHNHTDQPFTAQWWENHHRQGVPTFSEPSEHVVTELSPLAPARALEVGCGTGVDSLWLAAQGSEVTALDLSPTVIAHAQQQAEDNLARKGLVDFVVADITSWSPDKQFALVLSQYVHPDKPFVDFVHRLATFVAPQGTLLVVGHNHDDEHSQQHGESKSAIDAAEISAALDRDHWTIEVAEVRTREVHHDGKVYRLRDVVMKAHRKG